MGIGQNININRVWKKLTSTLMDAFEGVKTSVEGVTADVETSRELGLEPEYGPELQQSHDKSLMVEKLHLKNKQQQWFLGEESIPGEDAVKIAELATKDVEYSKT